MTTNPLPSSVIDVYQTKMSYLEENEMEEDNELAAPSASDSEGAFFSSLKRNNRQIRDDRATAIAEDTELVYKRKIEDLELCIKKMKREQDNMLDLSPTNAQSLILASDFNSTDYVEKDIELGIKIRNTEITLEIARKRYQYLFGGA